MNCQGRHLLQVPTIKRKLLPSSEKFQRPLVKRKIKWSWRRSNSRSSWQWFLSKKSLEALWLPHSHSYTPQRRTTHGQSVAVPVVELNATHSFPVIMENLFLEKLIVQGEVAQFRMRRLILLVINLGLSQALRTKVNAIARPQVLGERISPNKIMLYLWPTVLIYSRNLSQVSKLIKAIS